MTASTITFIRTPLSANNSRRRALHPFPQDKPMKQQSASFVRKNHVNEEEIIKEEMACEQSSSENIFRQPSRTEDSTSELEDMWTLKRANPIFSVLDDDFDEEFEADFYESPTKRARTQTLSLGDQLSDVSSLAFVFSADSSGVN
jgi:hypothetical protein